MRFVLALGVVGLLLGPLVALPGCTRRIVVHEGPRGTTVTTVRAPLHPPVTVIEPAPPEPVAVIKEAPPPVKTEVVGPPPSTNHVWVKGRWVWRGGRYVWTHGRWVVRPHRGAAWTPGRWVRRPGGWRHVRGHWR